jgi:hypothetical protein
MLSGKVQVTFRPRDDEIDGEPPDTMVRSGVTADGRLQRFWFEIQAADGGWIRNTFAFPLASLKASQADVWTALLASAVYDMLLFRVGFQESLEWGPGD